MAQRNPIRTFQPSVEDYDSLIANAKSQDKMGPYVIGRTLGEGSFGKVKIGIHEVTKQKVALKFIRKDYQNYSRHQTNLEREKKISKLLDHPNIVKLHDVYELPDKTCLVLEYVKGMELFDYIVANKRLKEPEAVKFFRQMVAGIEYCHANLVIHRDLKPENLLLDVDRNIKIADFGLSNHMTPGRFFESFCGSPLYSSPEVIEKVSYIGPEVDIWAMGVILYAMVTGYIPWDGDDLSEQLRNAMNGNFRVPSWVSRDCANLIGRMLTVDPKHRATIAEIRQHPWVNSGHKNLLPSCISVVSGALPIDEEIVAHLEGLGFDRKEVIDDVLHSEISKQTFVLYNLLFNKKKKEREAAKKREEEERRKQEEAARIAKEKEAQQLAIAAKEALNITIERTTPTDTFTITITQKTTPPSTRRPSEEEVAVAPPTPATTPATATATATATPTATSTVTPHEVIGPSSPATPKENSPPANTTKKRWSVGPGVITRPLEENSNTTSTTTNGGSGNNTPSNSPESSPNVPNPAPQRRGIKSFIRRSFGNLKDHLEHHNDSHHTMNIHENSNSTTSNNTSNANGNSGVTGPSEEGLKTLKMREISHDTTTSKSLMEVRQEIERVLTALNLQFKIVNEKKMAYKVHYSPNNNNTTANHTAIMDDPILLPILKKQRKSNDIKFQLSICNVQKVEGTKGLKFKRIKGDMWQYKALVERVIGQLNV